MLLICYVVLYWVGGVSDKECIDILNWIVDQCECNYVSVDIDVVYWNEFVQFILCNIFVDVKKVDLGFCFYYDECLFGDSIIFCVYCYVINVGGVDGRKILIGVGGVVGLINVLMVFNFVFNIE